MDFPKFLGLVAGAIFLFLVFRAILLWYWRVNELIDLLSEIRDILRAQSSLRAVPAASPPPPPAVPEVRLSNSSPIQTERPYEFIPSDPKLAEAVNSLRKSGYDVAPLGGAWRISKDSRSVAFPSNDGELLAEAERLTRGNI